jgi:hypothetical protein
MITGLLLLSLFLPLQDAPAGHDPAVPAATPPAAAAPTDKPAAPVPTETPEAVKKFLKDAEARLYDPQAAGLKSLEFDVPIDMPQVGVIGTAHVAWTLKDGQNVTIDRTGGKDLPPNLPPEMAEGYGKQMGVELLGAMLNRPITPMLDGSVAVMEGVEDGLVKVRFHNSGAEAQGVQEQSLYFDDGGLLQRVLTVAEVEGPMGKVKINQTQSYAWRPARAGTELVIAVSQKNKADMGMMQITADTTFNYATIADIVLPTELATTQSSPMGSTSQSLKAVNLKVNGQATPAAAPAPAAGG